MPPLETGLSVPSLRLSLARSSLPPNSPAGGDGAGGSDDQRPPKALLLLGQAQLDSKQAAAAVSTLQSALGKTGGASAAAR